MGKLETARLPHPASEKHLSSIVLLGGRARIECGLRLDETVDHDAIEAIDHVSIMDCVLEGHYAPWWDCEKAASLLLDGAQ